MTETPIDEGAGLPRDLGDGLTLRWATAADIEAVAMHNVRQLSDNPEDPAGGNWIRRLMDGSHPTTSAGDFTIVEDHNAGGKIVSSMCVIPQTWSYAGIPIKVGRPEAVSTDPAYRRRGLIREQFVAFHARGAARGELLQVIGGIGWYYRQFGYEMGLNLAGGRRWPARSIAPAQPDEAPPYNMRPATADDIEVLVRLYAIHCSHSLVTRLRDLAEWRYELNRDKFWLVEDRAGTPLGYAEAWVGDGNHNPETEGAFSINELAVLPGYSLRSVAEFLGQAFQAPIAELNQSRKTPLSSGLVLNLGPDHPAYAALGDLLEQYRPHYAWFTRVADIPSFLWHIAPVLERRLAESAMAGYSGTLRLTFYRQHMTMVFNGGKLSEVGTFSPQHFEDGDAGFPDLTFHHLLLGHRSLADLRYMFADCYAIPSAAVLLDILFPQQPSNPVGLI